MISYDLCGIRVPAASCWHQCASSPNSRMCGRHHKMCGKREGRRLLGFSDHMFYNVRPSSTWGFQNLRQKDHPSHNHTTQCFVEKPLSFLPACQDLPTRPSNWLGGMAVEMLGIPWHFGSENVGKFAQVFVANLHSIIQVNLCGASMIFLTLGYSPMRSAQFYS